MMRNEMKKKTKNSTMSEQFKNQIEKSKKEAKSIVWKTYCSQWNICRKKNKTSFRKKLSADSCFSELALYKFN
jgi:hypothetical protein